MDSGIFLTSRISLIFLNASFVRLPVKSKRPSFLSRLNKVHNVPAINHSAKAQLTFIRPINVQYFSGTFKVTDKSFVRIDEDGGKKTATMFGGLIGALVAEGVSDKSGPYILTEIDANAAHKELANLVQDCE